MLHVIMYHHFFVELLVVKYTDSNPTTESNLTTLIENIRRLNSHLDLATTAQENGNFSTYVARIINGRHLVIILNDYRELKNENTSISQSRRWITELETSAAYTEEQLQNVFLVYFGVSESLPSVPVSRIPIRDYPHSSNFDPETTARLIQEKIESANAGNQPEKSSTPDLSSRSKTSLTESWKEKGLDKKLTPLVNPTVDRLRNQSGTSSSTDLQSQSSATGLESESTSSFAMALLSEVHDLKKVVVKGNEETKKGIAGVHEELRLAQSDIKTGADDIKKLVKEEGKKTRDDIDGVHEEVLLARKDVHVEKSDEDDVDTPGGSST